MRGRAILASRDLVMSTNVDELVEDAHYEKKAPTTTLASRLGGRIRLSAHQILTAPMRRVC